MTDARNGLTLWEVLELNYILDDRQDALDDIRREREELDELQDFFNG